MSPRKSSTSSGRPASRRPRYLGLEVAGEHFPPPSPRAWERFLSDRFTTSGAPAPTFRVVRSEGRRAIAEVGHRDASRARVVWTTGSPIQGAPALRTVRTWGTLVGAKEWLRRGGPPREPE